MNEIGTKVIRLNTCFS